MVVVVESGAGACQPGGTVLLTPCAHSPSGSAAKENVFLQSLLFSFTLRADEEYTHALSAGIGS